MWSESQWKALNKTAWGGDNIQADIAPNNKNQIKSYKMVELVGEGFVINGATLSSF